MHNEIVLVTGGYS